MPDLSPEAELAMAQLRAAFERTAKRREQSAKEHHDDRRHQDAVLELNHLAESVAALPAHLAQAYADCRRDHLQRVQDLEASYLEKVGFLMHFAAAIGWVQTFIERATDTDDLPEGAD